MEHDPYYRHEWLDLTIRLAAALATIGQDQYLIIRRQSINHFVQFASEAGGILAEAVSNIFIEPPSAVLTVDDYQQLTEMGWRRPNTDPPVGEPGCSGAGRSPNFFAYYHRPVDFIDLAILSARTLNVVYGVRHPRELQYKAFTTDGVQVRIDGLQLRRARG